MVELYEIISWSSIISGLIVGILLIVIEKTNWKGLFIKQRILWILKRYERIMEDPKKEAKFVRRLGFLLDKGKIKMQSKGFSYYHNDDTVKDRNFGIHLTRRSSKGVIHQFLVRKLQNGELLKPDIAFFSKGYPAEQQSKGTIEPLNEFVEYFKEL